MTPHPRSYHYKDYTVLRYSSLRAVFRKSNDEVPKLFMGAGDQRLFPYVLGNWRAYTRMPKAFESLLKAEPGLAAFLKLHEINACM